MSSDESRFNFVNHDGRILVCRYSGERYLERFTAECHTGPTLCVLVWGCDFISLTFSPSTDRRYSEQSEVHHRAPGTRCPIPLTVRPWRCISTGNTLKYTELYFNARPHVVRIVHSFLCDQQVSLLPWPARWSDLSIIEHVWDMIARKVTRMSSQAVTTDELWISAWNFMSQTEILNLYR